MCDSENDTAADTRRWFNVGSTLIHRTIRWSNVVLTLNQHWFNVLCLLSTAAGTLPDFGPILDRGLAWNRTEVETFGIRWMRIDSGLFGLRSRPSWNSKHRRGLCKAKRQYLLACKASRYCLLALRCRDNECCESSMVAWSNTRSLHRLDSVKPAARTVRFTMSSLSGSQTPSNKSHAIVMCTLSNRPRLRFRVYVFCPYRYYVCNCASVYYPYIFRFMVYCKLLFIMFIMPYAIY